MFAKISAFINMPIIDLASGSHISIINNFILDVEKEHIAGFLCNDNSFLDFNNIESLGRDALTVNSEKKDKIFREIFLPVKPPLFLPKDIKGVLVVTNTGEKLGLVKDILINPCSGKLQSLEISDGLIKDLLLGRTQVKFRNITNYGEDMLIIKQENL